MGKLESKYKNNPDKMMLCSIVKRAIDKLDPDDLIGFCPLNEYEDECSIIVDRINVDSASNDIEEILLDVISWYLGPEYNDKKDYTFTAKHIWKKYHDYLDGKTLVSEEEPDGYYDRIGNPEERLEDIKTLLVSLGGSKIEMKKYKFNIGNYDGGAIYCLMPNGNYIKFYVDEDYRIVSKMGVERFDFFEYDYNQMKECIANVFAGTHVFSREF